MHQDRQEELNKKLIEAVENNRLDAARDALDAGADPNARASSDGQPVLFSVDDLKTNADFSPMLELLLNRGADVEVTNPFGDTLLYIAARYGKDGLVAQLLEAGADPLATDAKGRTPRQTMSNFSNPRVPTRLRAAEEHPRAIIDNTLTHDALFAQNANGDAPIDNCNTWRRFNDIVAQLEQNGEPPITKADLMQTDKTGTTYMARAILSFAWEPVRDYLAQRGEAVDHTDLHSPQVSHIQVSDALLRRERIEEFLNADYWQDKPLDELVSTWRKLSEDTRSRFGGYHQLCASKKDYDQAHSAGQRGR